MKHGAYHTVNENGYHALTCAILEQACADARAFAGYGILNHGKINPAIWPKGHGRRFSPIVQGYRHPGELQELVLFLSERVCQPAAAGGGN
jgi:hypothetical protein